MKLRSSAGFSIAEVLTVVAVIGILTAIARPAYEKYKGRAIQASAKANLTRVFAAEESFYAQYNTYHGYWPLMGFQLEHRGLFGDDTYLTYADSTTSRDYYAIWGTKNCGDLGDNAYPVKPSSLGLTVPTVGFGGFYGGYWANYNLCPINGNTCIHIFEPYNIQHNSFVIETMGCPFTRVTSGDAACFIKENEDAWTIDETRKISQIKMSLPGCP